MLEMVSKFKYYFLLITAFSIHGAKKTTNTKDEPEESTEMGPASFENMTDPDVHLLPENIIYPSDTHQATVIFLHLQGADGKFMKQFVNTFKPKNLIQPHIKFVFPCAPRRIYTFFDGKIRNIWFDRNIIDIDSPEDLPSFEPSIRGLSDLIYNETKLGIPMNKIIIGGWSMGGAMALHMAYRFFPELAGVFTMSSFLARNSSVYESLDKLEGKELPLALFSHGREPHTTDSPGFLWIKETFYELRIRGVKGEFAFVGDGGRDISKEQMDAIWEWIRRVLK